MHVTLNPPRKKGDDRMAKRPNSGSIGWGVMRQGRGLWSRNAVKGEQVRDERLRRDGKIECINSK